MAELLENKCKNCGGELDVRLAVNGVIECKYCHTPWTVPKAETSPAALQFLRMGEHDLDTCKFDDALAAYKKASELDSKEPEAYFGMALANFKVQYLKDEVNNCLQPICHEISEKVFTEDRNYKRALELATVEQKKVYRRKGGEIDDIRDEFYALKKSGLSYDCFLCAKVSEGNEDLSDGKRIRQETQDSILASEIYYALRDKGYKPFFSQREIKNRTGSAYEALILYALYTSECMLIVCSNEDYLQTKWVKSEYSRFLEMIKGEGKERDSLSFVFNGKPIEKLPNGKKIQGIDYSRAQEAFLQIFEFVKNHTPEARAKRVEAENRKKAEEEERKRAFEEQQHAFEEQQKQFAEQQRQQTQLIEEQKKELERLRKMQNGGGVANLSGTALLEALKQAQEEERTAKRTEIEKREPLFINKEKCIGCGMCAKYCAEKSIRRTNYIAPGHKLASFEIDNKSCIRCGECKRVCKFFAVETLKERTDRERAEQEALREEEARRAYLAQFEIENGVLTKYKGPGGNVVVPDGVTSIGASSFRDCGGLISIIIPDTVTSIGDGAFRGCNKLTSVTIPGTVTSIGDHVFEDCDGLESVIIGEGVTSIGEGAFSGCRGLANITIPDSVTSIGDYAFSSCHNLTTITIPDGVISIGERTFSCCSGLTNVTIPDGVISIGESSFLGCSGLTSITIPDGITMIGDGAFWNCSGLAQIEIPNSVSSIGERAFSGCSGLTRITIPDSVTSIGKNAFENCDRLISVTLPKRFEKMVKQSLGEDSIKDFSGTALLKALERVIEEEDARRAYLAQFEIQNGVLTKYKGLGGNVVIPDGVTLIGDYAFSGSKLTEIEIPNSVTSIGNYAFSDCSGLTAIRIPNSVTSIGNYAFSGSGLTKIEIPNGVTLIGKSIFFYCSRLTSITIPIGVTSIQSSAFLNCSKLTYVKIPNSVTSIRDYAFGGCMGLTELTIPDSVTAIASDAFKGCAGLTKITISKKIASISNELFDDCTNLKSVTIPKRFDTGFLHSNLKTLFKNSYKNIQFTFI